MNEKMKAKTKRRFEVEKGNCNRPNSISKGLKTKPLGSSKGKTPVKRRKRNLALINMNLEVCHDSVLLDLPIRTVSEANCFEPWQKKYGRHKDQKRIVSLFLSPLKSQIKLPCKVMLTRFAPDELDAFDNLPCSFKYIVDAICEVITGEMKPGKADGDKRITIGCNQSKEKGKEYGIRIHITY